MDIYRHLDNALGLSVDPNKLTFLQISLRAIIVFVSALVMVRLGDKRFIPKKTAFDAILVFVLASMLARAINGSAPLFATIGAGFVLVVFHRILARLACSSHTFGKWVKGRDDVLIRDGKLVEENMAKNDISRSDLNEGLRLNGQVVSETEVKEARIERSGEISVIPARKSD